MSAKKIKDTPLLGVSEALNGLLVAIRTKNPEVPNVMLVVGASGVRRTGLDKGVFSPKSWDGKAEAKHEIRISGETLNKGAEDVLGTLIHECAHALAEARGIQDTSRQGRFHNRRFRELGEELGITLTNDKRIGWSPTTLPKETAALYKTELAALRKALTGYRVVKPVAKAPKTTIRVECDCRGLTVPIKFFDEGGLTCRICKTNFLPEGESE